MKQALLVIVFLVLAIKTSLPSAAETVQEMNAQLAGAVVAKISFVGNANLEYRDLMSSFPVQPGSVLTAESMSEARRALERRDVFEHIDITATTTAAGVELTFLLTPRLTYQSVEFVGNHEFPQKDLQRIAGIRPGKVFNLQDFFYASQRVREAYRTSGYFHARLKIRLEQQYLAPQIVIIGTIDEGPIATISPMLLRGKLPQDVRHLRKKFLLYAEGKPASRKKIEELRKELLFALRNEGYLSAYVRVTKEKYSPKSHHLRVLMDVQARKPLTLNFVGNDSFSAELLLGILKMEKRAAPFSPDAIPMFVKNIKAFYQEHGYYDAVVSFAKLPSEQNRALYDITIHEGDLKRLNVIHFSGNTTISDHELRGVVTTRTAGFLFLKHWQPGFLTDEQAAADSLSIEELYRQHGFFAVQVSYQVSHNPRNNLLELTFVIDQGTRFVPKVVAVVWKNIVSHLDETDAQAELLSLKPNFAAATLYNSAGVEQARATLLEKLRSRGFPNAVVDVQLDEKDQALHYVVDAGRQVRVGKIYNSGNIYSHDFVINRELGFKSGALLSPDNIQRAEQSLYRLGLFRSVVIEPLDGAYDSPVEDLRVAVEERNTGTLEFGGALNTEDGVHLVASVGQNNFNGSGASVLLGVDGYFKTAQHLFDANRARATYLEPRVFGSKVELLNELFVQSSLKFNNSFSFDRYGEAITFRYPVAEDIFASVGYSIYYEHVFDVAQDVIIGNDDTGTHLLSLMNSSLEWDRRDDKFNPRSGFRTIFEPQIAASALGSEIDFYGVSLQHTIYTALSPHFVWTNSARARYLRPFGSTETIPLSQRLFLGGRNSLRGFSPNAVGPRGVDGDIVGGDASLILNSELQYEVSENVLTVLFIDAGQAILKSEGNFSGDPLNFSDLRYSPGLGLRYKTPIGPVGLDYGFALNREHDEGFGRLLLSIGQAF